MQGNPSRRVFTNNNSKSITCQNTTFTYTKSTRKHRHRQVLFHVCYALVCPSPRFSRSATGYGLVIHLTDPFGSCCPSRHQPACAPASFQNARTCSSGFSAHVVYVAYDAARTTQVFRCRSVGAKFCQLANGLARGDLQNWQNPHALAVAL